MLTNIFWICLIYVAIAGIWQMGEKLIYGQITPRILDDLVAIVLAISLYFNIK